MDSIRVPVSPSPRDFRDVPYLWQTGFYPIDETKLRARLEGSQLVMGDVADTAKTFFDHYNPAPIGAAFFDLDFHSSHRRSHAPIRS